MTALQTLHLDQDLDYEAAFDLMHTLRPHLSDAASFAAQVRRQATQGYRLLATRQGGQIKALEEEQKRRATRSLRDGIDRVLTDLLSLYRDVLLTALEGIGEGRVTVLVNEEAAAGIRDLAERWSPEQALAVVGAVEEARERLSHQVTPGLVLEALFARVVMAHGRVLHS